MTSKTFYLITPDKKFDADSELVKNLQRVLSAAGEYTLVAEPSNPVALLHVAIGLMTGTSEDVPGTEIDNAAKPEGEEKPAEGEEKPTTDAPAGEEAPPAAGGGDDDFTFESLGIVSLDGELVEAFLNPEATETVLETHDVALSGQRLDYMLNESKFAVYVKTVDGITSQIVEHRITVNSESALAVFRVTESKSEASKPRLIIGSDYKRLFA